MAYLMLGLLGLLTWVSPGFADRGDCVTVSIEAWKDEVRSSPGAKGIVLTTVHGEAIASHSYCLDFKLDGKGQKLMRLTWRFAGFLTGYPAQNGELFTEFSLRDLALAEGQYTEAKRRDLYMPRIDDYLSSSQYTKGADRIGFCVGKWPVLLHPDVEAVGGAGEMRTYSIAYEELPNDPDIQSYFEAIKQELGCDLPWELLKK